MSMKFPLRGKAAQSSALAPIGATTPAKLVLPANMQARYNKPKAPGFVPSPQQEAYFNWLENGTGSAILEAVAGAGKSTTILRGMAFMNGSIFCGAYNKSAAADLKAKAAELNLVRRGIYISTLHGLGYPYCKEKFKLTEVDGRKTHKLIDQFADDFPALKLAKDYGTFISKMVSFGKQFLIGCRDKPSADHMPIWLKLMEHFSVDHDLPEDVEPEKVMEWAIEIFKRSKLDCERRIDFDDMIYCPLAYDMKFFANDWILIDECQDINPARREMAKRTFKRGGRAVFVGDSRQAIYGFTGAGGDSIQRIIEEFKCEKLPLTVTYRCPKAVVSYVHQWVSHIEAHPDAPEGIVRPVTYVPERECETCKGTGNDPKLPRTLCDTCGGRKRIPAKPWFQQDVPGIKDVILCRYTRPLIQTAYAMIKASVACKVEGRDIGLGLISLARMWKISTIARLDERLTTYYARELAKAQKAGSEKKAQELEDKVATLRIFMDRCREQGKLLIADLIAEIESMFADDVKDVLTLCTGHKAKGREWDRVYWIQVAGSSRPMQDWEAQEEENVKYVIGTRAKQELILVPDKLGKAP